MSGIRVKDEIKARGRGGMMMGPMREDVNQMKY